MLLLSPYCPWWSGLFKKTKMVDFQVNLEAWLQETSLFGDEPVDSINIDDFISNEKANVKGNQTVLGLAGLEWFDEKVDLSVLNNPNSLLDHHNETKPLMEDESAFLLGLLGSSFDPSQFAVDVFKNEEIDFSKEFDSQNILNEPASSEILETHLASPQCNLLQVNSPEFFPAQSPASPYSDISDAPEETSSSYVIASPDSFCSTSDLTNSLDSSQIQVSVCDDVVASPSNSEPVLSLEEISRSVRKRKFANDGETRPKVIKVMFPEDIPVSRVPKTKESRERKKVQNKEAAARYRIKKRMEEKILSDEVADLEGKQKELQSKHDNLQAEIKYLKSLMCEILTKKGIMK